MNPVANQTQIISDALGLPLPEIQEMQTTGLAHRHYRLGSTGKLARVPIQSQHGHAPAHNLAYQAECFAKVHQTGSGPAIYDTLAVQPAMPFGALIVEEINGKHAELPADLPALATCLAKIHSASLPPEGSASKLPVHANPIPPLIAEIETQAVYLQGPACDILRDELGWMRDLGKTSGNPTAYPVEPTCLVCTDTHPGNFLIDASGKAFIVDLEKALYGSPSIDLAHASVYTSTTWDISGQTVLTHDQLIGFYQTYLDQIAFADAIKPWLKPMRRLLQLRALTWCAFWLSEHEKETSGWSKDQVPDALTLHVKERAQHFLSPDALAFILAETQNFPDWA